MSADTPYVVVKESYGSSSKERIYAKPPGQSNIVIVDNNCGDSGLNWLIQIFLPQGYPESVSGDYIAYQKWDTAQAFCSTISGILATQEVLRGVGVGDKDATPLAATITWILKDGCGHVGRILFAYTHGTYLDAYSKKWRIYADILNNAAMCIEIALPLFKAYATFALCISTMMKSIVGVAGGATRVAMTQHHAINGNLADVAAKDSAQETAVNLIASFTALFIVSTIGNSLLIFTIMMILHVTFNYMAVRAVCLRTLNEPRFLLVIDKYLKQEMIAAPCQINRLEPIIFYQMGPCILDLKISGFKVIVGKSLHTIFDTKIGSVYLETLSSIYEHRNYILVPKIDKRKMHILLKDEAVVDDVLCAYFHAILLAIITCALNEEPLPIYMNNDPRPFARVCHTLQSVEWSRHEERLPNSKFTYAPSFELMRYLDKIVKKEWPRVRDGLQRTGWDLSKHLIVTDQWRIMSGRIHPRTISVDSDKNLNYSLNFINDPYLHDIIDEIELTGDGYTIEPENEKSDVNTLGTVVSDKTIVT